MNRRRTTLKPLKIGYVPLCDAAVLIAAAERGFAESEGIAIELVREVSWANIRDKLILGMFDAAHMLAPLAIATSLGISHLRVPLIAPFALNLNGNAVTVSRTLFEEMETHFQQVPADAASAASALRAVIVARRASGAPPVTFGMVFPFSTHHYLLRHWLRGGGIDPNEDVQIVVVPPPYMAQGLGSGLLDGFCVGSPWNSLAVEADAGAIVALGVEIAGRAPEKVLAIPAAAAEQQTESVLALIRALRAAALWCEQPDCRGELAELLAAPRHLDMPASVIRGALDGGLRVSNRAWREDADFLTLGRDDTNRPDPRHAKWLFAEMVNAGQRAFDAASLSAAAAVYRPDLYDAALGETPVPPTGDAIALRGGPAFSADDVPSYIAALAGR